MEEIILISGDRVDAPGSLKAVANALASRLQKENPNWSAQAVRSGVLTGQLTESKPVVAFCEGGLVSPNGQGENCLSIMAFGRILTLVDDSCEDVKMPRGHNWLQDSKLIERVAGKLFIQFQKHKP